MSGLFPVVHMLFIGLEGNWISAQYILLMGFLYVPRRAIGCSTLTPPQVRLWRADVRISISRDLFPRPP
jgi:hypothetical protein